MDCCHKRSSAHYLNGARSSSYENILYTGHAIPLDLDNDVSKKLFFAVVDLQRAAVLLGHDGDRRQSQPDTVKGSGSSIFHSARNPIETAISW